MWPDSGGVPDLFKWSPLQAPIMASPVPGDEDWVNTLNAEQAAKGNKSSIVLKAISTLKSLPAPTSRPPELATLNTPPSSCALAVKIESDALLKPPMVPSQMDRSLTPPQDFLCPSASDTGTPFGTGMQCNPFDHSLGLKSGSLESSDPFVLAPRALDGFGMEDSFSHFGTDGTGLLQSQYKQAFRRGLIHTMRSSALGHATFRSSASPILDGPPMLVGSAEWTAEEEDGYQFRSSPFADYGCNGYSGASYFGPQYDDDMAAGASQDSFSSLTSVTTNAMSDDEFELIDLTLASQSPPQYSYSAEPQDRKSVV